MSDRAIDLDLAVQTVPADVLTYQNIRRNDPLLRIALLVCARYGLDLLLGHVSIIETRGGARRVYVTRDGYRDLAVKRGLIDGVRIVEEYQHDGTFVCVVWINAVGRAHPFEGRGYCDPGEPQHKAGRGRDQARARAERRALRWVVSLDVLGLDDVDDEPEPVEELDDTRMHREAVEAAGTVPIGDTLAAGGMRAEDAEEYVTGALVDASRRQGAARAAFAQLDTDAGAEFLRRHGIERGHAWPDAAIVELLGGTDG
jgi:hypothetical protein